MTSSPLREYQEQAADFLYARDRAMVLASVGAGKTAIALTAMQSMLQAGIVKRWLVVAPKRVAEHVWLSERDKWAPKLTMSVAIGMPQERRDALAKKTQVCVINYDNLQWLCQQYPASLFDGLVFDELTKLKNPSGERFKALLTWAKDIPIRWGLTGSFTSNGLEDTFGQCKIVDQTLLGRSKGAFLQEYFILVNKDFGQWEPRVGSLAKVMDRIKPATYLLDAGQYRDRLPPLHQVELRADMPDSAAAVYKQMKRDFAVQFPSAQVVAANAAAVTSKLQQMACGWVYESLTQPNPDAPGKFIHQKTPVWFSSHKFDLLDDLLDENQHDNTIVWYWYKEELAELKRRYPKAQTLDDAGAVERWNLGNIELLLAHPASAGHGINLQQGGSKCVFLSLPWSLELYEQAIGRLHRSGQTRDVWVYVLLVNKTVDEQIWSALRGKRAMSDIAIEALQE